MPVSVSVVPSFLIAPTEGWGTKQCKSQKVTIKKRNYRFAFRPVLWGHFLNWESFVLNDSSLCEVHITLTITGSFLDRSRQASTIPWEFIYLFIIIIRWGKNLRRKSGREDQVFAFYSGCEVDVRYWMIRIMEVMCGSCHGNRCKRMAKDDVIAGFRG